VLGVVALKQRCIPPQEAEARLRKAAIRGTGRIDALLRELIEELRGANDELQGLRGGQGRTLRTEGIFLGAMGELGMTGRGGIEREERRRRSGVRSLFRFILS